MRCRWSAFKVEPFIRKLLFLSFSRVARCQIMLFQSHHFQAPHTTTPQWSCCHRPLLLAHSSSLSSPSTASSSGVLPSASSIVASASCSNSLATALLFPFEAAMCNAVCPVLLVFKFNSCSLSNLSTRSAKISSWVCSSGWSSLSKSSSARRLQCRAEYPFIGSTTKVGCSKAMYSPRG